MNNKVLFYAIANVIDTFAVVAPLMLSPGPANMVSFLLGTRYSVVHLLPFQLGILLVYTVVAITLGLLSKQIGDFSPAVISTMQVIGGLFIIYLGIQLVRRTKQESKVRSPTFLNGITLQCLNPKFPGVALAVYANRYSQPMLVTASVICFVGAFALIAYSTVGSLFRGRQDSDRRFRVVDLTAGVLMYALGLWFVLQALIGS